MTGVSPRGTDTSTRPEPVNADYRQVAAFLGVPVETVKHWRKHGRGPRGYRIGRHVRFRWSDVEAWLQQQRDTP